jgi:hypothetical protein
VLSTAGFIFPDAFERRPTGFLVHKSARAEIALGPAHVTTAYDLVAIFD